MTTAFCAGCHMTLIVICDDFKNICSKVFHFSTKMPNFAAMYQITHHVATIDTTQYVKQYRDIPRFLAYCRQCDSYGRVWSCPPFERDVPTMTDGFTQVTVWGTVINFDLATRQACTTDEQRRNMSMQAIDDAWSVVLPFLHRQEAAHAGSRAFTGRCRLCRPQECSRIEGKPCRQPERMRSSLEAVGFDVTATARDVLGIELQWSTDGQLPERITLVTALFSHDRFNPPLPQ